MYTYNLYLYAHPFTHAFIHTFIHIYTFIQSVIHTCLQSHIQNYSYTACMHTFIQTHSFICKHTYTHTLIILSYVHTINMHSFIHTHMHGFWLVFLYSYWCGDFLKIYENFNPIVHVLNDLKSHLEVFEGRSTFRSHGKWRYSYLWNEQSSQNSSKVAE